MKLPELPTPAMVYIDAFAGPTRCYNETQFIEHGLACAEAMREACANECERRYMGDNNREDMEARRCAEAIRELEIET